MNAPRNLDDDPAWDRYIRYRIQQRDRLATLTASGEVRRGNQGNNLRKDTV